MAPASIRFDSEFAKAGVFSPEGDDENPVAGHDVGTIREMTRP